MALEGAATVTVAVTSADGSRMRVYRVRIGAGLDEEVEEGEAEEAEAPPPASPDVRLALRAGGQFLQADFQTTAAALFGRDVTIAWKFLGVEAGWVAYNPVMGVANFAIVPGDVLWVVSPIDQTLGG